MIIRAAGYKVHAQGGKLFRHRTAVFHHAMDIFAIFRAARKLRADRLGENHIHQAAALRARKNGGIDLFRQLFPAENHRAALGAERLMRRRRYNIRSGRERAGMIARNDQSGNMRRIADQIRAHLVRDFAEAVERNHPRVRRRAADNRLWAAGKRFAPHVVHVDISCGIGRIKLHLVKLAAEIHRRAVRQVRAMIQIHRKNRIARLQHSHIRRQIRA